MGDTVRIEIETGAAFGALLALKMNIEGIFCDLLTP